MKKYSITLLSTFILVSSSSMLVSSEKVVNKGKPLPPFPALSRSASKITSVPSSYAALVAAAALKASPKTTQTESSPVLTPLADVLRNLKDPQDSKELPTGLTAEQTEAVIKGEEQKILAAQSGLTIAAEPAKAKKLVPFKREAAGMFGFGRIPANQELINKVKALQENEQYEWTGKNGLEAQQTGNDAMLAIQSLPAEEKLKSTRELVNVVSKDGKIGLPKTVRQAARQTLKDRQKEIKDSIDTEFPKDIQVFQEIIETQGAALQAKYGPKFTELVKLNKDIDKTYLLAGNLNVTSKDSKKEQEEKRRLRLAEAISDNEEEHDTPTRRPLVSVSFKPLAKGLLLHNKAQIARNHEKFDVVAKGENPHPQVSTCMQKPEASSVKAPLKNHSRRWISFNAYKSVPTKAKLKELAVQQDTRKLEEVLKPVPVTTTVVAAESSSSTK